MLTGQKIARLRTQSNMTQKQLAEKLYVTRDLISKWETGKRRPDNDSVKKMSEIFSVDYNEIIDKNESLLDELADCVPDECCEDAENFKASLNSFLETLNDRNRSVFIRRYYYMEETSKIAEEYDIKESYVRTILMRTRKKLTKYFKEALK